MADNMAPSAAQIPLTIIVAATLKNGIGKNGGLPWPMIRKDMAYFASVTKRLPPPPPITDGAATRENAASSRRNVVIMGRKTWDSIPPKFRPLKDRTNLVISSQDRSKLPGLTDDVIVASSIQVGLDSLVRCALEGQVPAIGRAFVIGGTSIYRAALDLPQTDKILLTSIYREYECDTFFPDVLDNGEGPWRRRTRQQLQDFVGEEVKEGPRAQAAGEEKVDIEFVMYERQAS